MQLTTSIDTTTGSHREEAALDRMGEAGKGQKCPFRTSAKRRHLCVESSVVSRRARGNHIRSVDGMVKTGSPSDLGVELVLWPSSRPRIEVNGSLTAA